jgi:hypothetical protein
MSSPRFSSMTAPKMMLALASAAEWMISAASLTSKSRGRAPRDVEQDPGGALDGLLEQRRGDRRLGGLGRARLAAGRADAHERGPGVGHDRAHVGEVEVDQAGDGDEVRDALHALAQDVVGLTEGVEDARAALDDGQQLLVRDDDQGVDVLAQPVDALLA